MCVISFHSGFKHIIHMNGWRRNIVELDFEGLGLVDKELIFIVESIKGIWLQID